MVALSSFSRSQLSANVIFEAIVSFQRARYVTGLVDIACILRLD